MDQAGQYLSKFLDVSLTLPVGHLGIVVLVLAMLLVFGKYKAGLLLAYVFIFYWIFVDERPHFVSVLKDTEMGVYLYGFVGIFMAIAGVIGFFRKQE